MGKKQKTVNIDSILIDYEEKLNADQKAKLANYVQGLDEMDTYKLPKFGEELISSIFEYQQKIADMQSKLLKYIRSQQNIITLNFHINREKTSEAYAYIMFEIQKLISFIEKSKCKMTEIETEFMIKILALKEYIEINRNIINNPKSLMVDNIIIKLKLLIRQYKMMSNIFVTQKSSIYDLDSIVEKYHDLDRHYNGLAWEYYISKINPCKDGSIIRGSYWAASFEESFNKKNAKIIAQKISKSISGQNIIDILLDEEKLEQVGIFLMLKYSTTYIFDRTYQHIPGKFLNIDTMNSNGSNVSQLLNDNFYMNKYYDWNIITKDIFNTNYADAYFKFASKAAHRMAYIQCLTTLIAKIPVCEIFNNNEIQNIFIHLLKVNYDYDYGHVHHPYTNEVSDLSRKNVCECLLNIINNTEIKNSIMLPRKLFDKYFRYFDFGRPRLPSIDYVNFNDIKMLLLSICFEWFSNYLGINYNNYEPIKYGDDKPNHVKGIINEIKKNQVYKDSDIFHSLEFTLTKEKLYSLYLIFYTSFLVDKIFKIHRYYINRGSLILVLEKIKKIYQNFDKINKLDITKTMQKLFLDPYMVEMLSMANEKPNKNSKLIAVIPDTSSDSSVLEYNELFYRLKHSYYQLVNDAINEMINYFNDKEKNVSKTLVK